MPVVEATIEVRAPKEQVFALAQDYYVRLEWDPFLSEMRFLNGATEAAVGVHVRVKSKRGIAMEVEYTTVEPPNRVAVKMVKGPFFLDSFGGAWRFDDATPGATAVRFRYSFKSRWPLLRPILEPIMRFIFQRDIEARLRGLKRAAETTDILSRLGKPKTAEETP